MFETSRGIRNAQEVIVKVGRRRRSKGVCVRERVIQFVSRAQADVCSLSIPRDLSPSLTDEKQGRLERRPSFSFFLSLVLLRRGTGNQTD